LRATFEKTLVLETRQTCSDAEIAHLETPDVATTINVDETEEHASPVALRGRKPSNVAKPIWILNRV
jgi:hypothetical protein